MRVARICFQEGGECYVGAEGALLSLSSVYSVGSWRKIDRAPRAARAGVKKTHPEIGALRSAGSTLYAVCVQSFSHAVRSVLCLWCLSCGACGVLFCCCS